MGRDHALQRLPGVLLVVQLGEAGGDVEHRFGHVSATMALRASSSSSSPAPACRGRQAIRRRAAAARRRRLAPSTVRLASDAIAVAVEVGTIAGLADAYRRSARRPRFRAVFKRTTAAHASLRACVQGRQALGGGIRWGNRLPCRAAVTMVVTGLAVDVATVRIQAASMGTGPDGEYRSAQRDQQPKDWLHLHIPPYPNRSTILTKSHEDPVTRSDISE